MWNRKQITPPPVCELKVAVTPFMKDSLNKARNHLRKCDTVLQDHLTLLTTEQYVLKRIIYKLSNQFRSEKSLRALKQIKSCLIRLQDSDVSSLLTSIQAFVDLSPSQSHEIYLPSRQMLQHKLVRLEGLAALLTQTACYCQHAFICVRHHLEIGQFIPHNVVMLALASRIWFVSKSLCRVVCNWYQCLYSCLDLVQPTQVQWLPDTETLPCDLTVWLLSQFGRALSSDIDSEMSKAATAEIGTDVKDVPANNAVEDVGEPIQRSTGPAPGIDVLKRKMEKKKNIQESEGTHVNNRTEILTPNLSTNSNDDSIVTNFIDGSDQPAIERMQIKKQLKKLKLKSLDDVDIFETEIKAKKVQIGNQSIFLTDIGKTKILKRINNFRKTISSSDSKTIRQNNLIRNKPKLLTVLSRMLVKYQCLKANPMVESGKQDETFENEDDFIIRVRKRSGEKIAQELEGEDADNRTEYLKPNLSTNSCVDSIGDHDQAAVEQKQIKKQLKTIKLKSLDDFGNFQSEVNGKVVLIGNQSIHLTNIGKKKILKRINIFRKAISSSDSETMRQNDFIRNKPKLLTVLSRMLVRYQYL